MTKRPEDLARAGVLSLMGNTPMVPIRRLNPNPKVQLFAKLEGANPGGSVKDRIALSMIEAAEGSGELTAEKTILEATSGNTGIGLATVAAVKGYKILLVMSEGVSLERRKILAALGAEFLLTPADLGTDGAIEEAYRLAREEGDRFFLTDQFNNPANIAAHYQGTAVEVWEQTRGAVTHFVSSMGTTGTLMGCSKRLKELNPDVIVVGVEPYLGHKIQGLKNLKEAYVPGIYSSTSVDEKVNIEDDAAYEMSRRLAKKEGLLVGMSAGAAMHVAVEKARQIKEGVMVVILPDGGERYLSTQLFVVPEVEAAEPPESHLHVLNTFARRKEAFEPAEGEQVTMYTCGPTLYSRPPLGLYRRLVLSDVLRRHLEVHYDLKVKHVIGLADMDDRILAESDSRSESVETVTRTAADAFMEDQRTLNLLPAHEYPRSSELTEDMVAFVRRLTEAGFAYEKLRSVYFAVSKLPEYGLLSGIDLEKIRVGSTVDLDRYDKGDPRDFTLLRRSTAAELRKGVYIKTDWGNVQPSWHLQCSAMAVAHLGERFDIQISGTDLIFPHHENTAAQVCALTGETPSRFALHAELLLTEGKKMSRSTGTAVTVPELLEKGLTGRAIRYFLTTTHYRQPILFSYQALESVTAALNRLDDFVHNVANASGVSRAGEVEARIAELKDGFKSAMDDDLNVSAAMAALFTFARRVNGLVAAERVGTEDIPKILEAVTSVSNVLGFTPEAQCPAGPEILELIERRNKARAEKDFEKADRIRENLLRRGIVVEDTPQGTRWRSRRPRQPE